MERHPGLVSARAWIVLRRCLARFTAYNLALGLVIRAVFLGLAFPSMLHAMGRNYAVRQIAPHTFVWAPEDVMDQNGDPYFNRAGNVGFVITPDGVVVVNTANNPFHAREVLYEIRQRTDLPVRLVIDLGAQGDEMLGNEVFAEQHATIVSTSAAKSEMQTYWAEMMRRFTFDAELESRMRGIHITLPEQTFQGQTSFNLGGTEIRVTELDCGVPGTPGGDAAVYLPQSKVLFLGDLYVKGFVPQVNSRDVPRWIGVLGKVGKWDVATYVPGHGSLGTKADVANFRGFLEWLRAGVKTGIQQGKSLAQVERQLLSSRVFNLLALDLAPRTIAAVYQQILSARSAPARANSPSTAQIRRASPQPGGRAQGFMGAPPASQPPHD